ncbi:MAG: 2'-5' RNA ligase family protein [Nocardioides sp.]|nr:2'-5' RNA ligase family protein [Nocardioides sp.]
MPTIGVAVAIPDPWGEQLQAYRESLGDPSASLIPTHITLVPPTVLAEDGLAAVESHLADVAGERPAFRVHLRGTDTFRPVSPVVFVTLAEGAEHCAQLADAVRRGPLDVDLDFPYHPHVTVAHDVQDDSLDRAQHELEGFECAFDVEEFHLYVHDEVAGWRPYRDYALEGAPEGER